MQDTHLSSVLWFLVMKFKMARVRTKLLHGGFKVGASFGKLHVEPICVCVCAFKGARSTEAVGSQCTSQQFFEV